MSTITLPPATADAALLEMETVRAAGPVLVALDDDGNVGNLLRRAGTVADRLGVALRVVYVWSSCRPPDCAHHRHCHRDLGEASRLLATLLDGSISAGPAAPIEREVLHADDPAEALIALSASASALVVSASSDSPTPGDGLGETTRRLLGHTRCPLIVVPHRRLSATRGAW